MDVRGMIEAYLSANGYDGLWSEDLGCACLIGDIAPCENEISKCLPGYKRDGCDDECEFGGCDWHVVGCKPEKGDE